MNNTLRITIDRTEGFLQRLIGLIERRGYAVEAIAMPSGSTGPAQVEIRVAARDASRRIEVLTAQIMRIIGVHAAAADPETVAVGQQP